MSRSPSPASDRFRPYADYRSSRVDWLGQLPVHWEAKPLKHLATCLDGHRIPLNAEQRAAMQGDYPYWGANCIVDHVDQWLFDEDLVLLGEDGAPFFDRSRDVAFSVSGKIWVNNHAHVLRPKPGTDARFLAYALNTVDYRAFIDGSTRDKLTQDEMNEIPVQSPPQPEQRTIAAFLDRETAKIDELVAKKERLIELLEEKRAALITQAVTRGLDPNVPMKESGVEWLGQVPAHWTVKPFKRVTTRIDVGIAEAAAHAYVDKGVPIIRSTNVRPNALILDGLLYIDPRFAEKNRSKFLYAGDIVTVRTGNAGVSAVVPELLDRSQCFTLLISTLAKNQIPDFYCFYLNAKPGQTIFQLEGWGTAQINISVPILQAAVVPEPPYEEQKEIVSFIKIETSKLDALIAKVREALGKLREYRSALISAAVTGKIDVREALS